MSSPEHSEQSHQAANSAQESDRFAAQRAALAGLDHRPLGEHAEVFGQVHSQLQAALAEIDGI